jgi:hypothetical protein
MPKRDQLEIGRLVFHQRALHFDIADIATLIIGTFCYTLLVHL